MSGQSQISNSEFYMWRAIFAMAHADGVVSAEEIRFMAEILEDIKFSEEQKNILREDIHVPKKIGEMFEQISETKDQTKFFAFARNLAWADGDYGQDEQAIMLDLMKKHMKDVDFDALVGHVELELEGDLPPMGRADSGAGSKSIIKSFRDYFLKG